MENRNIGNASWRALGKLLEHISDQSNPAHVHKKVILMLSGRAKTLLSHVVSFTIAAGSALFFIGKDLVGSFSQLFLPMWNLFLGLFAIGAFVLGMADVFRYAFLVNKRLLTKDDLNSESIRNEIGMLIFFVAEICFALAALVLSGFVSFSIK